MRAEVEDTTVRTTSSVTDNISIDPFLITPGSSPVTLSPSEWLTVGGPDHQQFAPE
jgi:hypothetical protein